MQLRPYAAAAQTQVSRLQVRKQVASGFEECLDRFPILLVVVLPLLEPDGRTHLDGAPRGPHQVNAEAVSLRMR